MVDKNSALAKEALSAFSFAIVSSTFLSFNKSLALALKLLFLNNDNANKESIIIRAILNPVVILLKYIDFWFLLISFC